jgi:DNA-binding beta-propeller fold protein YncE
MYPRGKYSSGAKTLVANVGFFPGAVAVDSTRGFVYVADAIGNRILVYSTAGKLLSTIQ